MAATKRNEGNRAQQQMMEQQMIQQEMMKRAAMQRQQQAAVLVPPEEAQAEASFAEVLATFEESSQTWTLIIDPQPKLGVVEYYVHQFQEQGITIQQPAGHYVELIDGAAQASPEMLDQPMANVLRVLAILEYDFDNGQNKDALALKILGTQQAVAENKKRLGL